MKNYKYTAMDAQGKSKSGTIEAKSENDANALLKEKGLFPTSINKANKKDDIKDDVAKEKPSIKQIVADIFDRPPEKIKIKLFGLITILTVEKY